MFALEPFLEEFAGATWRVIDAIEQVTVSGGLRLASGPRQAIITAARKAKDDLVKRVPIKASTREIATGEIVACLLDQDTIKDYCKVALERVSWSLEWGKFDCQLDGVSCPRERTCPVKSMILLIKG